MCNIFVVFTEKTSSGFCGNNLRFKFIRFYFQMYPNYPACTFDDASSLVLHFVCHLKRLGWHDRDSWRCIKT